MAKSKKNKKDIEKEKSLEEIATMLKSSVKGHNEEESLEEDVDLTNLDLKNMEFHESFDLEEGSAPVLERIVGAQPRPIFVGGIPRDAIVQNETNGNGKDDFKYVPGAENTNEPKYIPTSESQDTAIERINTETLGRGQDFFPRANDSRFAGESTSRFDSQNPEKYERVERFDVEKAGRRNPFEPEDRRYKPKQLKG